MSKKHKPLGNPDAGHPLLQKLINSIEIVECESVPAACWDHAIMYDVRDALNASQARCAALEAALRKLAGAAHEAIESNNQIGLFVAVSDACDVLQTTPDAPAEGAKNV